MGTELLRLLQLCSPALPVGAFAYSEGLETVATAPGFDASGWIRGRLRRGPARVDAPIAARLLGAWRAGDLAAVHLWSATLHALRESRELREADRDLGQALARLLVSLGLGDAAPFRQDRDASFAALFTLAAWRWGIADDDALAGLLYLWLEGQVAAAVKLVPLGQTAGQKLLFDAAAEIPALVAAARALGDDDLGALAPGAAIAAARHEILDVRLFRS